MPLCSTTWLPSSSGRLFYLPGTAERWVSPRRVYRPVFSPPVCITPCADPGGNLHCPATHLPSHPLVPAFSGALHSGEAGSCHKAEGKASQGQAAPNPRLRPGAWYVLSLLCAVLAMKTKEIAFTLPLMLMLCEFLFFQTTLRKKLLILVPVLLTLIIIP